MAITREKKKELIQKYLGLLEESSAIVFVYASGLSVGEITQLRSKVRESGGKYHVIKNTLFRRALDQVDMPVPEAINGPVSVAFCPEDIAVTVKAIQDFAKGRGEREFEVTGGIVDNQVLDTEDAKALASLPTRAALFAQILAGMNATSGQLAGVVAGGIRQVLSVLQARVDQLQESEAAA